MEEKMRSISIFRVLLIISLGIFTMPLFLYSQDAMTHVENGILFYERNDYETAILAFTDAILFNPNHALAYMWRGKAYYMDGGYYPGSKFDNAIADFTQVIRFEPNSAEGYYNRGKTYFSASTNTRNEEIKNNYWRRAIDDLTRAISINPNYTEAYLVRGEAYIQNAYYENNAYNDFTTVINTNPYNGDPSVKGQAYYRRSSIYWMRGDYERHESDMENANKFGGYGE